MKNEQHNAENIVKRHRSQWLTMGDRQTAMLFGVQSLAPRDMNRRGTQ